jgi:hypothetical protein
MQSDWWSKQLVDIFIIRPLAVKTDDFATEVGTAMFKLAVLLRTKASCPTTRLKALGGRGV